METRRLFPFFIPPSSHNYNSSSSYPRDILTYLYAVTYALKLAILNVTKRNKLRYKRISDANDDTMRQLFSCCCCFFYSSLFAASFHLVGSRAIRWWKRTRARIRVSIRIMLRRRRARARALFYRRKCDVIVDLLKYIRNFAFVLSAISFAAIID